MLAVARVAGFMGLLLQVRGWRHGHCNSCRDWQVAGPTVTAAAASVPWRGCCWSGDAWELRYPPLLHLGSLELQAQLPWLGYDGAHGHCLCPSPSLPLLCSQPTHHLQECRCGSLQHPGVLGRETFVELWMLYCCRLKEEKQRECLMPP